MGDPEYVAASLYLRSLHARTTLIGATWIGRPFALWPRQARGASGLSPQLVLTSNSLNLRDWAKSRIKRVDFDVHFVPTTETQDRLARILEKPNPVFGWFAQRYLESIQDADWLRDDELGTAREVVKGLYAYAGREMPDFFPVRPLEELYDPDLQVWQDLLRGGKAIIRRGLDMTSIEFAEDLEHDEVVEYRAALPQIVKSRLTGKTLVVENPDHFHAWLEPAGRQRRWWRRLNPWSPKMAGKSDHSAT